MADDFEITGRNDREVDPYAQSIFDDEKGFKVTHRTDTGIDSRIQAIFDAEDFIVTSRNDEGFQIVSKTDPAETFHVYREDHDWRFGLVGEGADQREMNTDEKQRMLNLVAALKAAGIIE